MLEGLSWAAVKPLLLRLLPGAIGLLILIGTIRWIDHKGYQRAMADRDAADAKMLDQIRADLRQSERRLTTAIDGIAGDYQSQHDALARTSARLQPIILKEVARDPHLSDPAAGLTPGLLTALNQARAAGACATAASGRIACALPAAQADR